MKTVDNLAIADQFLALDLSGKLSNSTSAQYSPLVKEQELSKASKETSFHGSTQDTVVSTPAEGTNKPAATTDSSPPKQIQKLERQNGDASIYYFYIKANGTVLFIAWLFVVGLSALWQKMPCKCKLISAGVFQNPNHRSKLSLFVCGLR